MGLIIANQALRIYREIVLSDSARDSRSYEDIRAIIKYSLEQSPDYSNLVQLANEGIHFALAVTADLRERNGSWLGAGKFIVKRGRLGELIITTMFS